MAHPRPLSAADREAMVQTRRRSPRGGRLLPRAELVERARLEQLRASRRGAALSVLVLRPSAGSPHPGRLDRLRRSRLLRRLVRVLEERVRETDPLGWLEEDALAVLLADADADGARRCAQRLAAMPACAGVAWEIRTCPDLLECRERIVRAQTDGLTALFIEDRARFARPALAAKRALDIVGALAALVLFAPVMLAAALAIRMESPGPVLFTQTRIGQRGRPFVFYKLRSMRQGTDDAVHRAYVESLIANDTRAGDGGCEEGPLFKLASDPRVTAVGRFIRKTSIDELPQLFNVLKGDLSLVGPRPPLAYEVEHYKDWQVRRILEVKPGMTGLWQVEGRSRVSFTDMVRLDLRYARQWSLWLDLKILLKTFKVLNPRGESA